MTNKIDGKKFELLTKWYLRFNGYFTVDNFIIHAADDSQRISKGTVGDYTDIDILGVRMPFHLERTGELEIKNDINLNCIEKIDIVIGECKTGNQNGLNNIWKQSNIHALEYIICFCGITKNNDEIGRIALTLSEHFSYEDSNNRIRVILFGQTEPSKENRNKGLHFISLNEILNFLIGDRGQCWISHNLGTKSTHSTWDPLINEIFKIANDHTRTNEERNSIVYEILK